MTPCRFGLLSVAGAGHALPCLVLQVAQQAAAAVVSGGGKLVVGGVGGAIAGAVKGKGK